MKPGARVACMPIIGCWPRSGGGAPFSGIIPGSILLSILGAWGFSFFWVRDGVERLFCSFRRRLMCSIANKMPMTITTKTALTVMPALAPTLRPEDFELDEAVGVDVGTTVDGIE